MSDEERLKALRAVVRKELRPRRARPSLTERDARRLVRREVAAGEGRTDLDDGELKRVDGLVRFGRGVGRGYRRPDWVGELANGKADVDEVLSTILARVRQDPHENTLRAAQLLLNDLGRTDLGPKYFTALTQDVVAELMKAQDVDAGR